MGNRKEQKIIFLHSYLPRTGHNFVSEALKVFTGHTVLIHNRSETRLSAILSEFFNIYDKQVFFETDKKFLEHLFIEGLRERILEKSNSEYVMIKDTSFIGVDQLARLFPNDIHIILLRDPASVFNSLVKGMRFNKVKLRDKVKRLGISFGVYPYYYSRKLSNYVLKNIPDFENKLVLRYEDMVELDEETLEQLKGIFGTSKEIYKIKEEISAIEVINSSFIKETGASHIWEQKPKTKRYDPIKRKGNSYLTRLGIGLGSRKLRKKFNYI
ncbi:hypothetical protein C7S20_00220 [Christiangramia fulva]|uniref:Sulfotransferase domain-containing protein n=1 Tax=Christiangramia fulva TaxID=2126553 RepID=A0A2R3Z0M9_9FLAO|nr:sulfotransferase [Christiangramia fulva]AVR43820.1 hypothetical protein C7S20_00220 [Christiangramia fulva]